MRTRRAVDPSAVVADEWRAMGGFRRMLLWLASPNLSRAARYMGENGPTYAPAKGPRTHAATKQPGPATRAADRYMAGSRH